VVAIENRFLGHDVAIAAGAKAGAVDRQRCGRETIPLGGEQAAGGELAAVGAQAGRDVGQIGLGVEVLGHHALYDDAVPVVFNTLATGDVLLVADAVALAEIHDAPGLAGGQREGPAQGGRFGGGRQAGHDAEGKCEGLQEANAHG
jgi:hypothetical protein